MWSDVLLSPQEPAAVSVTSDVRRIALTLFRASRGIWHRAKWILPKGMGFIRSVASLAVSLLVTHPARASAPAFDIKQLFVVLSVFALVLAVINFFAFFMHKFSLDRNTRLTTFSLTAAPPEQILESVGQAIWTNPEVNLRLETAANVVKYDKTLREIDPLVSLFLVQFILRLKNEHGPAGIGTFDDRKLSLRTDMRSSLLNRPELPVRLQQTSYFRDRLSNGLINWRVRINNRHAFDFVDEAFEVRTRVDGTQVASLRHVENSRLANQLGGCTILITRDAWVVYLRQAERSEENRYKLAPSGSGSFDASSIAPFIGKTMQDFVRAEISRELCEECGLAPEDVHATQVCGYGRYVYRAGKPEFFAVSTTRKDYEEIEVPRREWDWQYKEKEGLQLEHLNRRGTFAAFCDSVADALEQHARALEENHALNPVSGPVIWNLQFAASYIRLAEDSRRRVLLEPLGPPGVALGRVVGPMVGPLVGEA